MKEKKQKNLQELENEGLPKRELEGVQKKIMYIVGVAMSLFHIYALAIHPTSPWVLYCAHMTFGFILIFALYCANHRANKKSIPIYDWLLMLVTIVCAAYILIEVDQLVYRTGVSPTDLDVIVGIILVLLVLEVARRTCGNILPCIAIVFLLYARFGNYIPGILGHKGYSWRKIFSCMLSMDAIFSSPMSASASMVFLFIVFGAFLQKCGSGQFFMNIALSVAGRFRGGPAKVAVLSSALFGTVSGNSVANVVSTGNLTIPMMKSTGYSSTFSAAVEATASTGGQIMPPILGSSAFIMASLIGEPYLNIVLAAIVPALMYFFTVFLMVDLEAVKFGLKGMKKGEYPALKEVVLKEGYLILPLIVLIVTLSVFNMSPIRAAIFGILSAIIASLPNKNNRMGIRSILNALSTGAWNSVNVVSACGVAGIVIGVLNLTGTGLKFASAIMSLSFGLLPIALILTMITSIILGMGLPTTASYLICASVTAPALVQMGLSPLAAHMFVFYFACISAITPPVALAAYAGAGIARCNPLEVAFTSCKIGISAFLIPFAFVYGPSILWQGSALEIFKSTVTLLLGATFLSFSAQGLAMKQRIGKVSRIFLLISSLLLIAPESLSDIAGFIIGGIVIAVAWFRKDGKTASASEPV